MKRRVMVLCPQAPWPRNGGALLRNYHLIDALRKEYAVDVIVADEAEPIPPECAALVDDYACFPRKSSERAGLRRLMRAALPGESSLTAGWTSPALRDYVAERLGRYPYIAIQTDLPMHAALPRRDTIPIVFNAHNCESTLLQRRAASEPAHIAAALRLEAMRVRHIERSVIGRSKLITACASEDIADFERFIPGISAKAVVIANGVDVSRYRAVGASEPEPCTVLITGSMDWRPNIIGLRWFMRDVLPKLRRELPQVVVRVAGRMRPPLIAELRALRNVEVVPNPAAMEPHLREATVVVAPIVASSGTRLRILEAWAAERPVVTTTAGAFGLECSEDVELVIRDDGAQFASALVRVLRSGNIRSALVANAAARVKQYDWASIGNELLAAYERLANQRPFATVPTISEEVVLFAAG